VALRASGSRSRDTLADAVVLAERAAACGAPHVLPLTRFVTDLRSRHGAVPDVDPFDGGAGARLLLLLETPGPGSSPLRFVSRDNPTGTASNIRRFCDAAGLARTDMLLWNAVPWVIHQPGAPNRAPRKGEIADGLAELPAFLALLPRLRVAVLAGRVAAEAAPVLAAARPGLTLLQMPHPSPTIVCTSPAIPARIEATLSQAARVLAARGAVEGSEASSSRDGLQA
jgi:uracil-DNA glycosylase